MSDNRRRWGYGTKDVKKKRTKKKSNWVKERIGRCQSKHQLYWIIFTNRPASRHWNGTNDTAAQWKRKPPYNNYNLRVFFFLLLRPPVISLYINTRHKFVPNNSHTAITWMDLFIVIYWLISDCTQAQLRARSFTNQPQHIIHTHTHTQRMKRHLQWWLFFCCCCCSCTSIESRCAVHIRMTWHRSEIKKKSVDVSYG